MQQTKRAYNISKRREKTEESKARVLQEAQKLFEHQGFKQTSLEQIADASGVAKPTLYSLFQSKEGILRAIFDRALSQSAFETLVHQVNQGQTAKERFAITAKLCRQLYEAESTHLASLKSFAGLSHELKILEQEFEERRYQRQEKSIKQFATKGLLRKGISIEKARDILWALTGREMYRMLVLERQWTPESYEHWLANSLLELLT